MARRIALVVAILAQSVLPLSAGGPATSDSKAGLPVGYLVASPVESFLRERSYTGALVARRRSVVSFERAGRVIEMSVDEGDHVDEGQLLARLDTRRLQAREAQAAAQLQQANAQLRELISGPREQTIAAARAEVKSLAAQRDVAKLRLSRRADLVESNAVSQEEYDEALYEYQAAAAQTDAAQRALDELEAGTRVERIEAQRAQVSGLEAQLADIRHEIEDATLLAPFGGRVAVRRLDEGTVVQAGAPVIELIEDHALEAWVGVPPASVSRIQVGAETTVAIDGVDHRVTVQSVRPELDADTRTQNVVLRLHEARGLVAGQVVRLGVREPVQMAGYWAPTSALNPDRRGLWSLLVVTNEGIVASRPVEVIENQGDRSFVRGAITPGERIIAEGAHRVAPGQKVTAKPVDATKP